MLEKDEQAQKKGIVVIDNCIGYNHVEEKLFDKVRNVPILLDALPLRIAALHFCYDIPQLRPVAFLIQNVINKDIRLRFRAHYGQWPDE